jgi:hypothetical protein
MNVPTGANSERVLSIDIRPHWFGYAAFQGPARLLDFGVTNFGTHCEGILRFLSLLNVLRPERVVLRKIGPRSRRNWPATKALVISVQRECRLRSIQVVLANEAMLRDQFWARGGSNKQEDAALLAQDFPELAWRLPPPRKTWQHEHRNMPIFDAVALGVSYFPKP